MRWVPEMMLCSSISNLSELAFSSSLTSIALTFNVPDLIMTDDTITLIPCSFNLFPKLTILLTTSCMIKIFQGWGTGVATP